MANREMREALRGVEEETFDIIAQVLTSDKWAELLRAPLEHAAAKGNRGLAQKLVRAGAEIGDALHEAIKGGHGNVVSDLLANGASVAAKDTSGDGSTPLHVAAKQGQTEMVQLLLVKGAEKEALDKRGFTPLSLAAMHDQMAPALALMAAGADVTLRCGGFKQSVAHLAATRGLVDVLRAAIKRGAAVNVVNKGQSTPLHGAALFNRVEAMDVLLEAGANVEARDDHGATPLHYAADWSGKEAVLALLKYGADVDPQDKNQQTPLHWAALSAAEQGAAEVVDSLLRSGADETVLNDRGEVPADVVARDIDEEDDHLAEDVDLVRELLANAPADRAWRRRGYLVLCRAHPDRVQQIQEISISPVSVLCRAHPDRVQQVHESSSASADVAGSSRSSAELARTEADSCAETAERCTVGVASGGGWAGLVARVLGMQEEGIFRTIVGYL